MAMVAMYSQSQVSLMKAKAEALFVPSEIELVWNKPNAGKLLNKLLLLKSIRLWQREFTSYCIPVVILFVFVLYLLVFC